MSFDDILEYLFNCDFHTLSLLLFFKKEFFYVAQAVLEPTV